MHQKALAPERYARGTDETILYSAPVESFLATSSWNRVYGEVAGRVPDRRAQQPVPRPHGARPRPGRRDRAPAEGGSGRAARPGARRAAADRRARGARARGCAPSAHDLGPGPWALLRDAVPVFQMIRVTSRAGVFLALPLAMLAAHGARRGSGRAAPCSRASASSRSAETADRPDPDARVEQDHRHAAGAAARLPLAGRAARPRPGRAPADARRVRARDAGPRSTRASTWCTRRSTGSRS